MAELTEGSMELPKPKILLRRRVRAWIVICVAYTVILGMAWFALTLIRSALKTGTAWDDRLLPLLGAGALLIVPVKVAWVFLRTRLTTGRWLMTKQAAAQMRSTCATRPCGPTHSPPWSWAVYAVLWANYAAMDPGAPMWKRTLSWTLLVAFVAFLLGITGLGVVCIGAGFGSMDTPGLGLILILFGAAMLLIPGKVVWSSISRFQTAGSIRISADELLQMKAQERAWQAKERGRPLRTKIISTAFAVAVLSVVWTRATLHHSRHPHEGWFNPTLWTIFAIYGISVQFRKPKSREPEASRAPERWSASSSEPHSKQPS